MALEISKISRMGQFNLTLGTLGVLRFLSLNTTSLESAEKWINESNPIGSEFSRWLIRELARKPITDNFEDIDAIDGPALTDDELLSLGESELEEFAEELAQKASFLLKTHDGDDIQRQSAESACDFLLRAFKHYLEESKAQWKRMMGPFSDRLFGKSTLDSISRTLSSAEKLRDTIGKYALDIPSSVAFRQPEPILPLNLPENPIHKTNARLNQLIDVVEGVRPVVAECATLIDNMNETALRMQADYLSNAKSTQRQSNAAIIIATLSLIVSSVFSYKTYLDANEFSAKNDAQIQAFKTEIQEIKDVQREGSGAIVQAIRENRAAPSSRSKIKKK